ARKYLVISIAMVAAVLETTQDRRVAAARVAVGACSAVACRLPALEAALAGRALDASLPDHVTAAHLAPLAPLDDVRATAAYLREAAVTLVKRALARVAACPRPTAPIVRTPSIWPSRSTAVRSPCAPRRSGGSPMCCATSAARRAPRSAATPAIAA